MMADDQMQARQEKTARLRALGIDPYPIATPPFQPPAEVLAALAGRAPDDERLPAAVAGRLAGPPRVMGNVSFVHVQDGAARLQLCFMRDDLPEGRYRDVIKTRLLDAGDFLHAEGAAGFTKTGEPTLFVTNFTVLAKALRPPVVIKETTDENGSLVQHTSLDDPELRSRKRYLDLIANPAVRARFELRSRVIGWIRRFMDGRGFLEVETPMMHAIPGGARARPFETHHNALDMPLFLRVAPELFLKRLLVGGFPRVYEINRNFRNEGISTRHNPEFTMMEAYQAFSDYRGMMELTETIISGLACEERDSEMLPFGGEMIHYRTPFRRVTYLELFAEHTGLDYHNEAAVTARARELNLVAPGKSYTHLANELFESAVEPHLIQPTFVTDYPTAICTLAKQRADNPGLCERFELFIAGMEIANAFSELNDPAEQRRRFERQLAERDDEDPPELDHDFLAALEHGMPPAGGLGLGIDRLVMLLSGAQSIREVILFPLLRPEE